MNATALVMREERNGGHLGWRASCSTPCLSSENEFLEMEGGREEGREEGGKEGGARREVVGRRKE